MGPRARCSKCEKLSETSPTERASERRGERKRDGGAARETFPALGGLRAPVGNTRGHEQWPRRRKARRGDHPLPAFSVPAAASRAPREKEVPPRLKGSPGMEVRVPRTRSRQMWAGAFHLCALLTKFFRRSRPGGGGCGCARRSLSLSGRSLVKGAAPAGPEKRPWKNVLACLSR